MDKNFSVLKSLSQVFMIYGITVVLLNVFCILFGASAQEVSTVFSLGSAGLSVATSFRFLLVISAIVGLRAVLMTDILIKKMPLAARIAAMFVSSFAVIIGSIFLFGWFPTDVPPAWITFAVCFVISCALSTLISALAEKQENRKLEEALKRYKEEYEGDGCGK
ncbi:MAG: DUF3021 family protein [Firmicutes bacterium]|nr:DUF3021 family protein [[Eubacterium] siraeum]MCM1488454.1 DUF3021 family protein [Bacillota bacterium]